MAWQDRDYYGTDGGGGRGFLATPFGLLSSSLRIGRWFGIEIRVHASLIVLIAINLLLAGAPGGLGMGNAATSMTILFGSVLLHEFGHCFAARLLGGSADEILMWPLGGLAMAAPPHRPLPSFLTSAAGPAVNAILCGMCVAGTWMIGQAESTLPWNPLRVLEWQGVSAATWSAYYLHWIFIVNYGLLLFNLLPIYPLDGGQMLQAVLWPWTNLRIATNVTCIAGMAVAGPMCIVSLFRASFWGVLLWAWLFMSAYSRRKQLAAEFTDEYEETSWRDSALQQRVRVRKPSTIRRWLNERKTADREKLQQQVDEILEKVAREGMHSLSEREKKALERASRELRDRDA